MNALRNVSGQALLIHRPGGPVVHLFPGRAVALADGELKSSQVQSLIARDLAIVQTITAPTSGDPAQQDSETNPLPKPAKTESQKKEAEPVNEVRPKTK